MTTTAIVRHRVADFDTWKAGFDAAADFRAAAGMTAHSIYTDEADPQMVVAVLDFESLEKAKAHVADPNLAEKMKELGVLEPPAVDYLNAR
jgi:hypothetical protein